MSPAGYSLAVLSSNRLRFADRLQWWGSFRLRSTGKTSQPSAGGRCCRRQNRQYCGRFMSALTLEIKVESNTIRSPSFQAGEKLRNGHFEVLGNRQNADDGQVPLAPFN